MKKHLLLSAFFCIFIIEGIASTPTGTTMQQDAVLSPQVLFSYLPSVEGWSIKPETEVFNESNLYNRINGAAPLFFENNFREMTSIEYTKGDNYITIQAYRHASPEDAFGMYASERSSDMQHLAIGGEGQGDAYGVYFFAGTIYVKISSNDESEAISQTMQTIAKGLAGKIDPKASYPAVLKAFPQAGKTSYSEAYITQNYIGHEFLKLAYTANYEVDNRKFQLFVVDGQNPSGAEEILKTYFKFTKQTDTPSEGRLMIKDRYNGNIPVLWKGRYIIGAYDENGNDFPDTIYETLEQVKL